MTTKTVALRSLGDPRDSIRWDKESPLTMKVDTRQGEIQTRHGRFVGGISDGLEVIEVDTGAVRAIVLPSRGMSLWELETNQVRFGWNSPVHGPVHPAHVPIFDPSGIGWLEGFDELVVRCGLESNGAPEHLPNGQLKHPLHGRIANLPASSLAIEYDEASGRLEVIGEVVESRLFVKRLRLRSRIRFLAGSADIKLLDDVTNELEKPTAIQLLYHINLGPPLLGEGAIVNAPIATLAPKDELSASEIETWNQYGAPETGFTERVYFAELGSDESGATSALLRSSDGQLGFGVTFNTRTLPHFIVWKNTAAEHDGYVTGLEPATNCPNGRSFEEQNGRVMNLDPGETASFRIMLQPLTSSEAVKKMEQQIQQLQGDSEGEIHSQPKAGWSPGSQ